MEGTKFLDSENTIYTDASIEEIETFSKTFNLRMATIYVPIDSLTVQKQTKLQQMWQGDKGTEKWEGVEEVDITNELS